MLKILSNDQEFFEAATAFSQWLNIDDGVVVIKSMDLSDHDIDGMEINGLSSCTIEGIVFILIDEFCPEPISTLAHEMVHAGQYLSGRLGVKMAHWEGHEIDPFNVADDYKAYRERPWEAEAFALQGGLARRYHRKKLWKKVVDFLCGRC